MIDLDEGVSIVMGTPESNCVSEGLFCNNIEDISETRKKKLAENMILDSIDSTEKNQKLWVRVYYK